MSFPVDPVKAEELERRIGEACAERGWCPMCVAPASKCGWDTASGCAGGSPVVSAAVAVNRLGIRP